MNKDLYPSQPCESPKSRLFPLCGFFFPGGRWVAVMGETKSPDNSLGLLDVDCKGAEGIVHEL